MSMKIGLLECDHVAPRFRHIAGDYREMFSAMLARDAPPGLTLLPFDICNAVWPASLDVCDAYLCTGSRHSALEHRDWIAHLLEFVREAHAARMPFVGICFGQQILARALGGVVERASDGWGVGVHRMDVVQAASWMQPPQPACRLQYMHQDQVVRLPPGAELLGRTEHCPVAMFQLGPSMLGIQGHPEFAAAYGEALIGDRVERIGAERAERGRASLAEPADTNLAAAWIARFLESASSSRSTAPVQGARL
jgi:GMP synthase-like glutamine amidotransferase